MALIIAGICAITTGMLTYKYLNRFEKDAHVVLCQILSVLEILGGMLVVIPW